MRKACMYVLFVLTMSLCANAEQVVGSYYSNYFEKNFEIEAAQENNKLDKVYIEVVAKSSKRAMISVKGEDLVLFKASLELVRDKYLEWVKIAKENNITEMYKDFDVKFPKVNVAWLGSKWWFSFGHKVKMSFLILESGKMVALWYPKVVSSSNRYIDETIYFVFEGEEDFNNLINQLDYNTILEELINTKKNEELFK